MSFMPTNMPAQGSIPNDMADTAYRIQQQHHIQETSPQTYRHVDLDAPPVIEPAITNPPNTVVIAIDEHQQQQQVPKVDFVKAHNPTHAYAKIEGKGSKSLDHHGAGWGCVYFGVILPRKVEEGQHNVFYCPRQEDAKLVAIKRLRKAVVQKSLREGGKENPYKEISLMQQLGDNHHVLGMIEAIEDEHYLYIVMPLCEKESLVEWIPWRNGVNEQTALQVFRNVLENMIYLHQRGCCHRDLSPDNCMIINGRIVFNDLAMSVAIPSDGSNVSGKGGFGKAAYLPPEVCLNYPFDPKSCDLWGATVVLFNMLTGEIGWRSPMPSDILFRYLVLARGLHRYPANERTVEILSNERSDQSPLKKLAQKCLGLSPEVLDLLSGVLHANYYERWSTDQVVGCEWVQQNEGWTPT